MYSLDDFKIQDSKNNKSSRACFKFIFTRISWFQEENSKWVWISTGKLEIPWDFELTFKKIDQSMPKDVWKILPDVLNSVRIIWELSRHYKTQDLMKGLLNKISN